MNAQADFGARSTVYGNMGGGDGEGCTVRARACTKERLHPVPGRGGPRRAHLEPCRRGKPPRL